MPNEIEMLQDEVVRGRGRLASERVDQLISASHTTLGELLRRMVPVAARFAQPGVSGYHVGAVAAGRSGAIYVGANREVEGLPLSHTIHAEQAVVANALVHAEGRLVKIALSAPPCGHCRQFLCELDGAANLEILIGGRAATTLAALLPDAFAPEQLGTGGDLLSHGRRPPCSATAEDDLVQAALDAADMAYAPYSGAYAGVALRMRDGQVILGPAIESVAFNPSLTPLGSALAQLALRGYVIESIVEAVIAERSTSPVRHALATAAALQATAPHVVLRTARLDG